MLGTAARSAVAGCLHTLVTAMLCITHAACSATTCCYGLLQAGVGAEMQGCTEKSELLKLAQEKQAAWEIRRVIR